MHWVRTNLRFGAWCALLALALQFAVSFGHVHVLGSNKGLLLQLLAPSSAGLAKAPSEPTKPAKPIAHDQCVICASIQLVSSLLPAADPSIQLLQAAAPLWFATPIDFALAASPHLSFRARAPPHA